MQNIVPFSGRAFVCRVAPRFVDGDGKPRGTLLNADSIESANPNADQRAFYKETIGKNELPSSLTLEFGQPPTKTGELVAKEGDVLILLVGADDPDGSNNERGIIGLARMEKAVLDGVGTAARCVLQAKVVLHLKPLLGNDLIKQSDFYSTSGIDDIKIFGLAGAPQAHNFVRFFKDKETPEQIQERVSALLGMCAEMDADTKTKLEASYPELAALVPDNPPVSETKITPPSADVDASQVPALVQARLRADGLIFEPSFVEAFLLALKTKPFLILSGISGTGKSALPRALSRMVGNDVQPIAVAPDWTDNADMLGYFDINGHFVSGEFTTLLAGAALAPDTPFFIVLDEMNLARVEYYFAQVLSVLESRRLDPQSGTVTSDDYLFNAAMRERLAGENNPTAVRELAGLRFGPNVYIIGTVNIDETTHPFSKKVLDRANVLEINDVDLMQGLADPSDDASDAVADAPASNAFYAGNLTRMSELRAHWASSAVLTLDAEATLTTWVSMLAEFASVLRPHNLHFGFRVRDEVCIYLYHAAHLDIAATAQENWWHPFFDQQLVQKVLTRLSGEADQIEATLVTLFNLCVSDDADYNENAIVNLSAEQLGSSSHGDAINARFPLAARKLWRMLREILAEGRPATSFWTA